MAVSGPRVKAWLCFQFADCDRPEGSRLVRPSLPASGFLSPIGPPGRIMEWLRAGGAQAVLDDRIAAEYAEVLTPAQFVAQFKS